MTPNDKSKTGSEAGNPAAGMMPGADGRNRIDAALGRRVRTLREGQGLPLEHLAGFLRIGVEQLQGYEDGRLRIPAAVLFQIATVLQQPVGAFYEGLPKDE